MFPNFYAITAFINFLTSGILAILVVLKNKRNPKNLTFFFLASVIAFWSLSYYMWQISDNADHALFWCRVLMAFIILIPGAFLHFAFTFTETQKKNKKIIITIYSILFVFFLINLTPYFIRRVEPIMNFKYWPIAEPITTVFIAFFAFIVIWSSFILIRKYQTSTGIIKLQTKYVATGMIISFIGGSLNFLPWFRIPFPPVTNAVVPLYVIMMAYAITRYRLMDIRLMFRQILFYFGISFGIYIIFYLIAGTYVFFFGDIFAPQGYLIGLIIFPLFAIIMYGGSRILSEFINKYFFPSLYNYQQAIIKTSQELSHYTNLNKIIEIVTETIQKSLHPEKLILLLNADNSETPQFKTIKTIGYDDEKDVSSELDYKIFSDYFKKDKKIILKEELDQLMQETKDEDDRKNLYYINKQMEELGVYLCLSLTSGDKLSGVIFLGAQSEADSYTQRDIELLEVLSYQAGIAIDNAMLYRRIEEKNIYLQELINIKNDFIRIANHQLNTPLSIIRNAYSMVKDGSLTPKKAMIYMGNGIDRLSQILQDLWDTFQLETTDTRVNIAKTDIEDLVKDSVDKKKELAVTIGKNIKIQIETPDFKIPFVLCDPIKITHALSNLLDNAIFYTSKGSVTVSYELVKNKNWLKINIIDTGVGFSAEEKKKMAQKFFRSKKAISMHTDGSGLGLYISRKIIERNDGELTFDSKGEGQGATFSFTVPVYKNNNHNNNHKNNNGKNKKNNGNGKKINNKKPQ